MHTAITDNVDEDDEYQEHESNSGHIFHQSKFNHLSKELLLLDNQSTLHQIVNKIYLTYIQTVKKLTVFCNAGSMAIN